MSATSKETAIINRSETIEQAFRWKKKKKLWDLKLLGDTDHSKTSDTFDLTLIKFEEILKVCIWIYSLFFSPRTLYPQRH